MAITKYFLLIGIIILSGCSSQIICEEYSYSECPAKKCTRCGDSLWSSALECHSEDFCEQVTICNKMPVENCTAGCSVCPPCEECSAVVCQTTEICEELGFDEGWY